MNTDINVREARDKTLSIEREKAKKLLDGGFLGSSTSGRDKEPVETM